MTCWNFRVESGVLFRASANRVAPFSDFDSCDAFSPAASSFASAYSLTAFPIVEALDCFAEPVDHAQFIPVTFEVQSLAGRLKRDLLEIAWTFGPAGVPH